MKEPIVSFDDVPIADDETVISGFENPLLATLVVFARAIRDHRRDPAAIRETLLNFIFNIAPAERAVILPVNGDAHTFEPIGRHRGESAKPIRVKQAIVDQVGRSGVPILSRFTLCLAMQAFHSRPGIIYLQHSNGRKRFNQNHLELSMGLATVAAIAIEHAARVDVLETEKLLLQEELDIQRDLIGKSPRMSELKKLIHKAAAVDSTILIYGESGTGKEVVARLIHEGSKRVSGPFVAVNCGAIPEGMLESELFGHEKGAFTGAIAQKKGRFELATGGTLLLDEIGEMPPAMQVKLLRVLQEKEIERVGGTKSIKLNVRIIAATNRDLRAAVAAGEFRQDLYYRLNVWAVPTPPLREHRDDILPIAHHFMRRYAAEINRNVRGISSAAENILKAYDWPGNVRELQNVIERAVGVCSGTMLLPGDLVADLQPTQADTDSQLSYREKRDADEKDVLETALIKFAGNCHKVAHTLGVDRATVYRKVKRLKLSHLLNQPR